MLWVRKNRPTGGFTRRDLLKSTSALGIYYFPIGDYLSSIQPSAGTFDVVVYGGTISAINAAYTAGLAGATVALVCPDPYLGGMTGVGGLTTLDLSFGPNQIGGVFWEQFQAMAKASGQGENNPDKGLWPSAFGSFVASNGATNAGYVRTSPTPGDHQPDPRAARAVLNATAAGILPRNPTVNTISVFMNAPLTTYAGSVYPAVIVNSSNPASPISAINTAVGTFVGTVFIDASYEGDIMAAVSRNSGGCSYAIGRESATAYSESFAGVAPDAGHAVTGMDFTSYPFPVIANPSRTTGAADNAIQVYTFRVPVQLVANGGVPFKQPAGYDASLYTFVGKWLTANSATTFSQAVTLYDGLPASTGRYTTNDVGGTTPFAMYNQNLSWPDGTPTQRATIRDAHIKYNQGLLYYLQTDSAVPASVRTNTALYGLDPLAYPDISVNGIVGWPWQLYIREGRRGCDSLSDAPGGFRGTAGKYQVLKQADVTNGATQTSVIGKTCYIMDCHAPLVYYTDATHYTADGALFQSSGYGTNCMIPMECMIPAAGGCPNLITSVCHGSSHVAWSVMRMEPTFATCGEAAGFMAALVAKRKASSVQTISYTSSLLPLLRGINAKIT